MVRFASLDALLTHARAGLTRLAPTEAYERAGAGAGAGAVIVDVRPGWQRSRDGEIPGSLIVERNQLEWRLHPHCSSHICVSTQPAEWIIICEGGYSSSLAAAALRSLDVPATDVVGGVDAWIAAGLPLVRSVTVPDHEVPR
jgi:rhodanese-related sulfurtransferase